MVMAVYAALLYMPEGSDWATPEVRQEWRRHGQRPRCCAGAGQGDRLDGGGASTLAALT